METRTLFPLGKAYGKAFCNREQETERLVGHVKSCKHTLLIAPRRFGKSSLAERALQQAGLPNVKANFHLCTSEDEIAELIVDTVIKLIGKAIGQADKIMASIKKYLSHLEPSLSFGTEIASLKLIPKRDVNYAQVISEALMLIEHLLADKKKRAVIFFDEFQEVNQICKESGVEGAIRTAAQEMQYLAIIFSGSIRALLVSMFDDEARPLYKLCRKIKLERISQQAYQQHLQKIAKLTWSQPLTDDAFERIIQLSNRHPYYMNYLCDEIWQNCSRSPSIHDIDGAWQQVISEEWSDSLKELSELALSQRKVLKYIANNMVTNPQSQEVSQQLSLAPSTIGAIIRLLIKKDYIERNTNDVYRIINPMLFSVLTGAVDQ